MSRKSDRNANNSDDLARKIIDLGQNKQFSELQALIAKCDIQLVCIMISISFFTKSITF